MQLCDTARSLFPGPVSPLFVQASDDFGECGPLQNCCSIDRAYHFDTNSSASEVLDDILKVICLMREARPPDHSSSVLGWFHSNLHTMLNLSKSGLSCLSTSCLNRFGCDEVYCRRRLQVVHHESSNVRSADAIEESRPDSQHSWGYTQSSGASRVWRKEWFAMEGTLTGGIGLGLVLEHPALVYPQALLSHVTDQQQANGSSRGSDLQLLHELRGTTRTKSKSLAMSDEEEPSFTEDGGDGHNAEAKNKKTSAWQRMKWTDSMVKLLIGVVLLVGEDNCLEGLENSNKRKVGILQKKGKWKSVAQLMMEKGCYVSPQQCEDKFNDLNKRYKRLNDVLGKDHASAVVDNRSLLRSMDHLSPKAMDDARRILSSRHLFYKEMMAYHSGDTAALAAELDFESPYHHMSSRAYEKSETVGAKYDNSEDDEEVDEDEKVDEDDNREDACQKINLPGNGPAQVCALFLKRRKILQQQQLEDTQMDMTDAEGHDGKDVDLTNSSLMRNDCRVAIDGSQQWKKYRAMQLKEQKMGLQAEAFNLEKQRFKWQKVTCKKDREIERMRLENERMKLENDRIALQLKQRELELDSKKSEISMTSISILLEKLNANDKKEPGNHESVLSSRHV